MAQIALRLRRALSLSSALLSQSRLTPTAATPHFLTSPQSSSQTLAATSAVNHRLFHSTPSLSLSSGSRSFNDIEKIDPDTILFEGCDYKHWLIVMDFGKDPNQRPPPDQMVETYVQTAAKVLGSVELAKKRIYACSTTTYTGFQVEVDEDMSKAFEGLPGVTFVLPDSYVDPVNKEYGGDKYINGEIIPRPPPVQYGRPTRRVVRPTEQRPSIPMHNRDESPAFNQHGSMPYRPQGPQQGSPQQQTFPSQQNHGSSGPAYTANAMPSGTPHPGVGRDGYQGGQSNFVPPQQGNYGHDYNHPQHQTSNRPVNHGGDAPPGQFRNVSGDYGYNRPPGQSGNHPGYHGGYPPPAQMGNSGDNRDYSPSRGTGVYGQRGARPFEQSGADQYGQGPSGNYNQGAGTVYTAQGENHRFPHTSNEQSNPSGSYKQGAGTVYTAQGENQRFPQTSNEQSNPMEHGNYPPGTQTGFNQGRY